MQNLLVFYGGKSVEHDISILTAIQTMKNINKQKYNIIPIYLTKKLIKNINMVMKDLKVLHLLYLHLCYL